MKTNKLLYFIAGILITLAGAISYSFRDIDKAEPSVEVHNDGRLQYKWYAPETPKSMSFCDEKVPLDRQDVFEQFDREVLVNYYYHTNTIYMLKLATRYFPFIEARLKANGVPDDFKYLCAAESALQNQISKSNAVGYWQFMKETGIKYGLRINDEVDERYDIAKATDAACDYLKEAHAKYGNWTAAAASYNCGTAGYDKFSSYQQTRNYYDLMLPDETMRYIFRILAIKYIMSDPKKMGFIVPASDSYKPYKVKKVVVSETIQDLAQFASDKHINYRMLKILNPWLRNHSLTVKPGQSFEIQLPDEN